MVARVWRHRWEAGERYKPWSGVNDSHYRAPELLFSETYDPQAIDLWSAGVTLSECFAVDLGADSDPLSDSDDDEIEGFQLRRPPPRQTLFSAEFGEIGLAGSIFRVLGTPTEQTWPVRFVNHVAADHQSFASLTDANKLMFDPRPPRQLRDVLEVDEQQAQLLEGLVRLEAGQRLSAKDALTLLPPESQAEEQAQPALRRWIDSAQKRYEKFM